MECMRNLSAIPEFVSTSTLRLEGLEVQGSVFQHSHSDMPGFRV